MKIVALGDSTTAGTPGFLSPLEAPPDGAGDVESQYAFWLSRTNPGWQVLNRGVNRERTDQIAARFERDVIAEGPAAVIIIGGVNDIYDGWGVGHAIEQLGRMYQRALDAGIAVIAGSILPFNTATPEQNAAMRDVNDWIRKAARRPAIWFADTRRAVARAGDPDRLISSPDGLHPDVAAYRLMAEALEPVLENALRTRRR
jgi:lysophospholipase L1-like esterase